MPVLFIGIIIAVIGIILFIYSTYSLRNIHKINQNIDKENEQLKVQNNNYCKERDKILNDISQQIIILNNKKEEINQYQNQLNDIQNNITKTLDNQKELSQKAFDNYYELLEKQYKEAEDEYAQYTDAMETAYSSRQIQLMKDLESIQEELTKLEATRTAAIQAQLKEKEIENNSSFYCLQISDTDLKDVSVLESIKPKLNNERILSMLVWQTYFRTPMTNLCNNIIGKEVKTGIYKITNQKTKECYIGQAVDLATRWKNHAKCGLGIDTPAGNKLYKAMQDYGIWNFSWEILELCSKDQLDEKERYYIKLYQAKEYGYNSKKI